MWNFKQNSSSKVISKNVKILLFQVKLSDKVLLKRYRLSEQQCIFLTTYFPFQHFYSFRVLSKLHSRNFTQNVFIFPKVDSHFLLIYYFQIFFLISQNLRFCELKSSINLQISNFFFGLSPFTFLQNLLFFLEVPKLLFEVYLIHPHN